MRESLRETIMGAIADNVTSKCRDAIYGIADAADAIIASLGLTSEWPYRFERKDGRHPMTSDGMQARIAWAIHRESYLDDEENMPDEPDPGCYEFAQAVIDDLHLTMETREHFVRLENNGLRREVSSTRVVGVWEAS